MPVDAHTKRLRITELLRDALAQAAPAQLVHRLDAVMLVAQGRSCQEVGDWFGVDRRTIERWVHAAYVSGLSGLATHHAGGKPATLSVAQWQSVLSDLRLAPSHFGHAERRWSGKRLAQHLHQHHGVQLSVRSCQRLIAAARRALAAADGPEDSGPGHVHQGDIRCAASPSAEPWFDTPS